MVFDSEHALVHPSEQHRSEVDVPEAVADFLEADELAGQGVGDADPSALPADAAVSADIAHLIVSRVLDRGKGLGEHPRRRSVAGVGRFQAEGLMRSLLVVLGAESVEADLLRGQTSLRETFLWPIMAEQNSWPGRFTDLSAERLRQSRSLKWPAGLTSSSGK